MLRHTWLTAADQHGRRRLAMPGTVAKGYGASSGYDGVALKSTDSADQQWGKWVKPEDRHGLSPELSTKLKPIASAVPSGTIDGGGKVSGTEVASRISTMGAPTSRRSGSSDHRRIPWSAIRPAWSLTPSQVGTRGTADHRHCLKYAIGNMPRGLAPSPGGGAHDGQTR